MSVEQGMGRRVRAILFAIFLSSVTMAPSLHAQQIVSDNPLRIGDEQKEAVRVNEAISVAYGFGNTFLLTTPAGNVVIDTSNPIRAPGAKELLKRVSAAPVKYIVLTHAHGDHAGGVKLWREPGTEIIAQKEHYEFVNYQTRLAGFFGERNAAQFNYPRSAPAQKIGNFDAEILPTVQFDQDYAFSLGGVDLKVLSTPGETPDHLTVWVPKYKAAFIGDNYYESFPNIYTLRGTKPRWALDYIASLDRVLALEPELVLPSHGEPIRGNAEIKRRLTRYRDAIRYVHDAVVAGMNAGKDVYTLMHEIHLPSELQVGEGYGNLIWSIRGIYEGYAGWFDMNPATMYDVPIASVFADVTGLAGGPDAIAGLAAQRLKDGKPVEALHLTGMSLASDPAHRRSLEIRLEALQQLRARSANSNERGWLDYGIRGTKARLAQ
jgi:alkyl sulfatase BDS1-like metallo-beta-lactamase superfamily hydrolase